MQSSVGLVDIDGVGGNRERRGGGGGGGGRGKSGMDVIGVGDDRVGILGMDRVAERWWESA